jgi:prevent-host-death family protein
MMKLDRLANSENSFMDWNLADAKNRFSEVVNLALTQGPQRVRRRKDTVVIVSAEEYERLTGERPAFRDYLSQGESFDGLDLTRDRSPGRDVAP